MVMAKESNILRSLAFSKFFLCVLNRFDKNNEQKQANKKQRKANKQKKFKEQQKIADDILYLMKSLLNTGESTLLIVIQTIDIYNSKIGYL